jgi:hypothetical protein
VVNRVEDRHIDLSSTVRASDVDLSCRQIKQALAGREKVRFIVQVIATGAGEDSVD